MWSDEEHIRSFRMHAHHLDRMLPAGSLKEAALIGFQNSPPAYGGSPLFRGGKGSPAHSCSRP